MGTDSLAIVVQGDRLIKSCHDSTWEGELITSNKPVETRSLFTGHLQRPRLIKPEYGNMYQPDWIPVLLMFCFVLQAWVMFYYRKRIQQVILSPFSRRYMNQLVREGNLFNERLSVALGVVYFITLGLLIYETNVLIFEGKIPQYFSSFAFYLIIILVLILYWFAKILMISILGVVFKTPATTTMYLQNVLIVNISTGLVLLPLIVFVIYLKSFSFLYISLTIFILSFVFLLVRGFFIGLTLTKFSYVFLFVYLCSLEILPLIIMVKLSKLFYNSMIM